MTIKRIHLFCSHGRMESFWQQDADIFVNTATFYVLEHSNFPAFSLPESCSQTDKFPKNSLDSRTSINCECAHIAYFFPSRRPIFAVRPSKVYFSGCQFKNRMYNKSIETSKSFEVDFTL